MPLLGAIADDFTGATDLCSMLVRNGMRAVQMVGVPPAGYPVPDADALTVALKSRTAPVAAALEASLAALVWLRRAGCRQFFFKYCSTFDSTPEGNIGPVAEGLLDALGIPQTIYCPAFPENGRTLYKGHLFVGDRLLSDTHMRHHPLTPMTDSNLVRWLGRQTRRRVGLADYGVVSRGPEAIRAHLARLRDEGVAHVLVDALEDAHLRAIGRACRDFSLITGGSGVAMGLPENFRAAGLLPERSDADRLPPVAGYEAVLAGSCSAATLEQVAVFQRRHPALRLDPLELARGLDLERVMAWARPHLAQGPVLVYASAPPEEVARVQESLGRERAGALVEQALAAIATALVREGTRRLVVAGGETSGAVVEALGIRALRIGPAIDPGVPATVTLDEPHLALALKSGNFGAPDFFLKAFRVMP
ncbi:hypothetical protein HRbin40_01553 [bacterium HR40]|nr:hypothetical protein HRbin40_01553 [bacterium HR40]